MRILRFTLFLQISVLCWSCSNMNTGKEVRSNFISDIENFMFEFIEETNVPGMGFAFYSDSLGSVISVVGKADIENNIPIEITTLYPIQSTTKFFLAIVTLQLIKEEELTLESTIDQWFEGLPNSENVTIRHLLQHTSGYNNYQENTEFNEAYYSDSAKKYTRNDFIDAGFTMPYNPDDLGSYKYSNTNSLILAEIIETITNKTIGQEFHQRIFEPVKMRDTYYKPETSNDRKQIIKCYRDGLPIDLERTNYKSNAAGGIISTLDDMMRFARWVLDNNYPSSMSSELIDKFEVDEHEFKYGLGMEVITNMYGTTLMGHAGGNPGFIHEFYFSTETNEIIILFFNKWPDESSFQFRRKLKRVLELYR